MRRTRHRAIPRDIPGRTFPTADEIAALAHELFVSGGRRLIDIPDHWRAAEQQLLDRAARRVLARCPARWLS